MTMKFIKSAAIAIVFMPVVASPDALALEIKTPQAAKEKCFPAEGLVDYYAKFKKLKPARLDTIEPVMTAEFIRNDEAAALPKMWARVNGQESAFSVAPDGQVNDFHDKVKALPSTAELCGEVITAEGEEPKIGLSLDNNIIFKNRTGPFTLAELQDGVGDGKSLYKKLYGGAMAMFVPKMTHVSVQYREDDTPLDATFTKDGQVIDIPPVDTFGGGYFIALEDIEASGADTMMVGGGAFILSPSPSVKKMKQLGFSEGDDD